MTQATSRLETGIAGLDELLSGGLLPRRAYLLRGGPGSGKSTLGLHFLTTGAALGEKVLYITLEEPEEHIRRNAELLKFDLSNVQFLDLSPTSAFFSEAQTYDIFSPAEVEREPITKQVVEQVEKLRPVRVLIDPMTQFRYLASDVFQYRRQILSFLRFLVQGGATVLFSAEASPEAPDDDLQFLSDGVIELSSSTEGRRIAVSKFRGSYTRPGWHGMSLTDGGMVVYPQLIPDPAPAEPDFELISSGVPELDELLEGGIERGTITILTGPSGVGKTSLGLQFMKEAAGRGERSVVYSFEEDISVILRRCQGVNIPARAMMDQGSLSLVKVEPLRYSPDEFANAVREEVERRAARVVMIDSVAGYSVSLRGKDVVVHLHALCKYLQSKGIATILVNEVQNITGDFKISDVGISYVADNVMFMRYLEINGEMRKAIGVLKKRVSNFEKTLREFEITRYGIKVGRPLAGLRKILSGAPEWIGTPPGSEEK